MRFDRAVNRKLRGLAYGSVVMVTIAACSTPTPEPDEDAFWSHLTAQVPIANSYRASTVESGYWVCERLATFSEETFEGICADYDTWMEGEDQAASKALWDTAVADLCPDQADHLDRVSLFWDSVQLGTE